MINKDALIIYCEGVVSDFPETRVWMENIKELHTFRVERLENLLRSCLSDYGDVNFTDRHGMADRIRKVLEDIPR